MSERFTDRVTLGSQNGDCCCRQRGSSVKLGFLNLGAQILSCFDTASLPFSPLWRNKSGLFSFLLDNPLYQIARETAPGETLAWRHTRHLSPSPGGRIVAHPDVPPRPHPSQLPGHFLHFLNTNLFLKTLLRARFLIESSESSQYWQNRCSCTDSHPCAPTRSTCSYVHMGVFTSSTSVCGVGQSTTHPLCAVRQEDRSDSQLPPLQSPRRQGPRRFREMRCVRALEPISLEKRGWGCSCGPRP